MYEAMQAKREAEVTTAEKIIRSNYVASGADVNNDQKIGMEEALYILQKAAEVR
jgi:hypothetical protein